MSYRDIQSGWSEDIIPFYEMIAKGLPKGGTFVEVGVFMGRSFACMGELRPDLDMWAIDPWRGDESQGFDGVGQYGEAIAKLGGLWPAFLTLMIRHSPHVLAKAHIVRAFSHEIAFPKTFKADAIFIDGAHDYESVRDDIKRYLPHVKPGGIISGHDYQAGFPGVVKAVDECIAKPQMGPGKGSTVWCAIVPQPKSKRTKRT